MQSARPPIPDGPYLIFGLARSGIAAARALHAVGVNILGADRANIPVAEALELGMPTHAEAQALDLLDQVRTVVKSPGIPDDAPLLRAAEQRGLTILGEMELAWRMLPNEFLAVTGTNGKTTTVELIGHIHRLAGIPAVVAGNVGTALCTLVGQITTEVTVICEASSFQLQDTISFAPQAAVLLNLTPDHLDRHGSFESYRQAKLEIFARQGPADLAVLPCEQMTLGEIVGARRVLFGDCTQASIGQRDQLLRWHGEPLLPVAELSLRGQHNVQNAMAAAAVCLERGVPVDAVREALRSFAGVAHRLQQVALHDGVVYVNDSKATNTASTIVALQAFADQPVHLILGGQGKAQDFSILAAAVHDSCRAVYLIGEDALAIERALVDADVQMRRCDDLEAAVASAAGAARPGDVVLLSPGCASFDQYENFQARGEHFAELVRSL